MTALDQTRFRYGEQDNTRVPKLTRLLEHLIAAEEITLDDAIVAIARLLPAADRGIYFTSATEASLFTLTAFARTILDDADAGTVRTTIDAQQADAQLSAIAGLTPAADQIIYWTGPTAAAMTSLTSVARTLLGQTTQANMRSAGLGLGTAAVKNTGTSGDAVPLLNTTADFSGRVTGSAGGMFGGLIAARPIDGVVIQYSAGVGSVSSVVSAGTLMPMRISGSDVRLSASGADRMTIDNTAANFTVPIQRAGVQVLNTRVTGFGAMTGTATKTAIATYTAPVISSPPTQAEVQGIADALQALSRRVKAGDDAMFSHGMIGA